MYHRTGSKTRAHAFYCMLGISMLQFVLLYPPQGEKGPHRTATVLSRQTLTHQSLADALGLGQLRPTLRG